MFLKEFFYFQKSDRKAILFLLVIAILVIVFITHFGNIQTQSNDTPTDSLNSQKIAISSHYHNQNYYYDVEGKRAELFPFDPNTADSTQLLRLGLQPWQVRNIYKYRSRGGVYRQPSDFARLYGLTQKQYLAMKPFLRIGNGIRPASELVAPREEFERDTARYPVKIQSTEHVALNLADTSALKKVPGIGSYYARQIINYRNRLGGFYSVSQLREIEDFPHEAATFFVLGKETITKLNLNKLTLNQLKRHPYINFYQARAIADYRRLKGAIKSIEELRLLKEFSASDIARLSHYVDY